MGYAKSVGRNRYGRYVDRSGGFSMQIYFDFSGYSDMAIGLGRMFGFEFIENFNYPYISKSITEFLAQMAYIAKFMVS